MFYIFSGCNGLKSVVLGKNVIEIDELAFNRCKSLNSVSLPQSVEEIWSSAFYGCSNLSSIVIPDGVKTIHKETFRGCSNLKQIIIGSGVERIYDNSFAECSEIADVYCYAEQPPVTSITAFNDSYIEYATLHVQESAISSYKGNRPWSYFKDIVRALPIYTLTYLIDGEVYKSYMIEEGATISPESIPAKEGYTFLGWKEIPETMPAYDVTVKGSFSINSYKLKYVVDGVEYKTVEVEYNSAITPEAEPTKEGHTFSGWSEIPEIMPANDVTVTGSFTVNTYTLTYMVDNDVYKTSEVVYGTTISPEAAPTKTGYSFSGWENVPLTMPAKDVTVSGTFTINSYKLTYIVDGEEYKTFEIVYDSAITPEAEPTKEGHTFSGWSEIPETMPANDVTVTGSFTVNTYMLTYMVDGEVYKTSEVDYSTTITPEAEPTKEGHTFSGWSEIPETMPANDVTVTGSFTVNTYTLTYMIDGEVYKTSEVAYGTTITPEAAPTKTGYSFSGWDDVPLTMPAKDVTISGTFTINSYKLTYIVDGEEYKIFEIVYDSAISPEAEPTKEGYTFSGWSEIPETMPANDVTVTGSFIVNKYQITYIIDGEVFTIDYVEYGATIVPPTAEEKEGFTFSGWDDIPETMPAHDIVVHASYTSGIIGALMSSQQNVRIYSPNGKKRDKLQKGLNIVILDDGTVKKVVVK